MGINRVLIQWGTTQKADQDDWDIIFPITFQKIYNALINTYEEGDTYLSLNYWYEFKSINNSGCTIHQEWKFGKCYYLFIGY